VVGALEYKGEAERLKQTQMALRHSLEQLAEAPLAQQEPAWWRVLFNEAMSYSRA
jgi:hypothetical protein